MNRPLTTKTITPFQRNRKEKFSASVGDSRVGQAPARLATRLSFLAAGFGVACWAPLVPFAKSRVGADDAQLGLPAAFWMLAALMGLVPLCARRVARG